MKNNDQLPEFVKGEFPVRDNRFLRWVGRVGMRLMGGWKINGSMPAVKKAILPVAPHTSNWDFPVGAFVMLAMGLKLNYLGKNSLFRFPIKTLMTKLGGIPVDRSAANGVVGSMVEQFRSKDELILVITPEGTRKKVTEWKKGFLHMAKQAKVPVIPVAFDFARKAIDIGPALMITDEIEKELLRVKSFFAHAQGKRSEASC
ncbi:acyltransferase [Idiomarina sp. X4]|uniref:lysophospholipid acyltransferase family protein n=1 Tax=unclassified Idiomarina TaxID=2614829 RepID=UPI000C284D6F|nr:MULTISPECIES: lysophospholipid acyltransferase family protein [unclassified Idiomarina]ATZ73631.1 acyltransferase [Idiomarina sp. X4]RXS42507.1 acyltransferase [Idiomarina sp. 29L]